ncbi:MAG: hypothetical protein GC160_21500 [Acidobacteria bacterium]|nr:hypothetical protein [Acidobacteriota bacterium]
MSAAAMNGPAINRTAINAVGTHSAVGAAARQVRIPFPVTMLLLYLAAITVIGKGPTYLGVPPLFWGEMVMLTTVAWTVSRRGFARLLTSRPREISTLLMLYMGLGAALTAFWLPTWKMAAVRDAAVWFYAIFFAVGITIAEDDPLGDRVWIWLRRFFIVALVWNTANYLTGEKLSTMGPLVPFRGVPLLSNSREEPLQHLAMGFVLVLATNMFRGRPITRAFLSIVSMAGFVFFMLSEARGVKVGFALGVMAVVALGLAPGRKTPLASRTTAGIVLGCIVLVLVLGVANIDFGEAMHADRVKDLGDMSTEGTAYWRLVWWKGLFREVMAKDPLFGLGFGVNLSDYSPILSIDPGEHDAGFPVRSPHNINMTVFSRMGLVGAVIWVALLATSLGGLFLRIWRGRAQGVPYTPERREELQFWILMLLTTWGDSSFAVLMEGPVMAIWFWFALGFSTGRSLTPGTETDAAVSLVGTVRKGNRLARPLRTAAYES